MVTGPGAVTFWWRVSSEQDFDGMVFEVNGSPVDTLTGGTGEWDPARPNETNLREMVSHLLGSPEFIQQ